MIGHAPSNKNITPPTKLSPAMTLMTTRKPVAFSDRCGVNSAENSVGSGARGASGALLSLMRRLYRLHGAQDDPIGEKEIAEPQAETLVSGRSRGGVPPSQEGEPSADDGTQFDQSVHAAGRRRTVGAG